MQLSYRQRSLIEPSQTWDDNAPMVIVEVTTPNGGPLENEEYDAVSLLAHQIVNRLRASKGLDPLDDED